MNVHSTPSALDSTGDIGTQVIVTEQSIVLTTADNQPVFYPEQVMFRAPGGTPCSLTLTVARESTHVFATPPGSDRPFSIAEPSTILSYEPTQDGRTLRLLMIFPDLFLMQGMMVYTRDAQSTEDGEPKIFATDPQVGNDPPAGK